MYAFNYHRPATPTEAADLLAGLDDAKYLAGGQSLVQSMKLRLAAPSDLVDLGGMADLRGITAQADSITIGAMTRHADVARHADVQARIPGLASLAAGIGDNQVRNMGTLGGSIANADPAACYPAAVLGLGATVHTLQRAIAADDFFVGLYETALEPAELITSVSFPVPQQSAYIKFKAPASRFALVGVFVARTASGVRVAVTGAKGSVFRVPEMEAALATNFAPEALQGLRVDASELNGDLHASADYRAHLITVIAQRAVAAAR